MQVWQMPIMSRIEEVLVEPEEDCMIMYDV